VSDTTQKPHLGLIEAALALQQDGGHESAIEILERARKRAPEYAPIYLLMGISYQELNRLDDAESCMRQALDLEPEYAEAQQALGLLLSMRDAWGPAIDLLKQHLEADPTNLVSLKAIGRALLRQGRQEEAARFLRAAWQETEDTNTGLELGRCLIGMRRLVDAEELLRQVVAESDSAEAYVEWAVALTMLERHKEAISALEQAIERDPGLDRAWRGLAYCYGEIGELGQARKAADRAVSLDNRHPRNWEVYSAVFLKSGRTDTALKAARQGLDAIAPDHKEPRTVLIKLLSTEFFSMVASGDTDEALARLSEVHRRFQADEYLAVWQVSLLILFKKYEEALVVLDEVEQAGVRADGNLAPWRYQLLHLVGRPEAAWIFIEPTLSDQTDRRLRILADHGVRLYGQGEVAASQSIFEQLLAFAPSEARFACNLGFILTGEGDLSEAEQYLTSALSVPAGEEIRALSAANLGYLYAIQGNFAQAGEYLQLADSSASAGVSGILRICYWLDDRVVRDYVSHPNRSIEIETAVNANQVTLALAQSKLQEATALAQQMVDKDPLGPWGHAMQGWVSQTRGNIDAARHAWKLAQKQTRNRRDQKMIAVWLESLPAF
jgi:tetratricopeptide (TPR) repeat protein